MHKENTYLWILPNGLHTFKDSFAPDKLFVIGNDGITWQEFLALDMTDLF